MTNPVNVRISGMVFLLLYLSLTVGSAVVLILALLAPRVRGLHFLKRHQWTIALLSFCQFVFLLLCWPVSSLVRSPLGGPPGVDVLKAERVGIHDV
jgi:hypothetical protein